MKRPGKPEPLPFGAEKMIAYTANQSFLSRIYLIRMDGSVYKYHEYDFYRFCDLQVVDNQLYAAEAFAPRVYKVDVHTGALEVIIDDWSLYYIYCLGFDGSYFYVDEWNFRRYDMAGTYKGSTSYNGTIYGCAWDGNYLWNLDDDGLIRCWDITNWPTMNEISANHFRPPSDDCRGLWFDGQYFWSAESLEDTLGKIYQFDHQGMVIKQWTEPAFRGWGACTLFVKP
jgi:hypothetical protein